MAPAGRRDRRMVWRNARRGHFAGSCARIGHRRGHDRCAGGGHRPGRGRGAGDAGDRAHRGVTAFPGARRARWRHGRRQSRQCDGRGRDLRSAVDRDVAAARPSAALRRRVAGAQRVVHPADVPLRCACHARKRRRDPDRAAPQPGRLFVLGLVLSPLSLVPMFNILVLPIYAGIAFAELCLAELVALRGGAPSESHA